MGGDKDKGREVVWVRLGNEVQKRKVMETKKKLRGKKERILEERILEDWTWKERKMRWKLEEIAREEMKKEKRYG